TAGEIAQLAEDLTGRLVCGSLVPARRPSAGAVPGRGGTCLAAEAPRPLIKTSLLLRPTSAAAARHGQPTTRSEWRVAIENADPAGSIEVQHAEVIEVFGGIAGGGVRVVGVAGDAAGVFDRQRAVVEDSAALVVGGVAGDGAAAERQRAVVEDAA